MPHPKNRLKLTGDTHLPDVGELLNDFDDVELAVVEIDAQPRVYADGWVRPAEVPMPQAQEQKTALPEPVMQAERNVEKQVAATPWLAIAAALGFGFLVAKMLRS